MINYTTQIKQIKKHYATVNAVNLFNMTFKDDTIRIHVHVCVCVCTDLQGNDSDNSSHLHQQ